MLKIQGDTITIGICDDGSILGMTVNFYGAVFRDSISLCGH